MLDQRVVTIAGLKNWRILKDIMAWSTVSQTGRNLAMNGSRFGDDRGYTGTMIHHGSRHWRSQWRAYTMTTRVIVEHRPTRYLKCLKCFYSWLLQTIHRLQYIAIISTLKGPHLKTGLNGGSQTHAWWGDGSSAHGPQQLLGSSGFQ